MGRSDRSDLDERCADDIIRLRVAEQDGPLVLDQANGLKEHGSRGNNGASGDEGAARSAARMFARGIMVAAEEMRLEPASFHASRPSPVQVALPLVRHKPCGSRHRHAPRLMRRELLRNHHALRLRSGSREQPAHPTFRILQLHSSEPVKPSSLPLDVSVDSAPACHRHAMSRDRDGQPADTSRSVFVRFKHHVDSNIASGFNTLLGVPTAPRQPRSDDIPSSTLNPNPSTPTSLSSLSSSHLPSTRNAMDTQPAGCQTHWDVFSLVSSASYSPTTLRHLPQPVPNDLPRELDPITFTFEDAFEDLLAVSQGQPLPDINTRYEQRKLLQQMFPTGEPTWFWMRRLESQGLIESPSRGRFVRMLRPDWDSFHRELDRRAADIWRGATAEDDSEQDAPDFFQELGRASKQIQRRLSEEAPQHEELGPDSDDKQRRQRGPDTFDDLFSSISSTVAEGQRSWDTFLRIINDQAATLEKQQAPSSDEETKQIETRDEYVDRFGYLHSTVTRKTLGRDGNEVGRETYVTMRPADKPDKQLDNQSKDELDHVANEKTGWFWK